MGESIHTFRPAPPTQRLDTSRRTQFLGALQDWNARLIDHYRFIRVLDAVRWRGDVERDFFASGGTELPRVSAEDYRCPVAGRLLNEQLAALRLLESEIVRRLGTTHAAGRLLLRRCRDAQDALRLIAARGTREFVFRSREIYGSSLESKAVRDRLRRLVRSLESESQNHDGQEYDAEFVAAELRRRMADYFGPDRVTVRVSDALNADACAGNGYLKVRRDARFSAGDIDLLEAHECWAHIGTTFSGHRQPVFNVLSRCSPGLTSTQEGLAVLTEIMAGACHPARRRRLALRLRAVMMAEEGADFLQVYAFFRQRVDGDREAYRHTARVFRGSLPTGLGPFTKDLTYGAGLLAVVSRLRTAADGRTLALLFSGKACLEDLGDLAELHDQGLLVVGEFVPPPFRDPQRFRNGMRELASW